MSTAKWGGVKIRDVLKHCGMDVDSMALGTSTPGDIKHVQFEGYDTDETGKAFWHNLKLLEFPGLNAFFQTPQGFAMVDLFQLIKLWMALAIVFLRSKWMTSLFLVITDTRFAPLRRGTRVLVNANGCTKSLYQIKNPKSLGNKSLSELFVWVAPVQ